VLLFVVALALVIAFAVWSYQRAKARRDALFTFAATNGLEYSRDDPYGLVDLPFHLFSLGDGRGCENVLSGSWKGLSVREADYWYYDQSTDADGKTSRSYHRFSIVLAGLDLSIPQVSIQREGLMSRLAEHVGFRDIQFESEEFNRRFQVKSQDREFAYKLLDARMMRWLLDDAQDTRFELLGNQVLVSTDPVDPGGLSWLFDRALAFREHVPRLVWNEYGTGRPAGAEERSAP
jgi:hypothetical protein